MKQLFFYWRKVLVFFWHNFPILIQHPWKQEFMFLIWVLPLSSVVASMQKGAGISVLSWICKSGELNPFSGRAWHRMSQPANKAHPVSWPALQASGIWMPELNFLITSWTSSHLGEEKEKAWVRKQHHWCCAHSLEYLCQSQILGWWASIRRAEIFCFPVKFSAAGGWVSGLGFFIDLPDYCDGWRRHVKCVEGQIFLPPHPIRTSPGTAWQNHQHD